MVRIHVEIAAVVVDPYEKVLHAEEAPCRVFLPLSLVFHKEQFFSAPKFNNSRIILTPELPSHNSGILYS